MLIAALQYVHEPTYHALILRRTFQMLSKADSILSLAKDWLLPGAAYKEQSHTFTFPSGATLEFGHVEHEESKRNYDGPAYQFVGLDEACHFSETMYTYIAFGRSRRKAESKVPLRRRLSAMPGGPGMPWVKKRFMTGTLPPDRRLIKAFLEDNPFLDQEAYRDSLMHLPLFERNQLLSGDWSEFTGKWFRPHQWPTYIDLGDAYRISSNQVSGVILKSQCFVFVTVDWATSEKETSDFTAIGVWALTPDGRLLILEVINDRFRMEDCPRELARVCCRWNPELVAGEDDVLSKAMIVACREQPGVPEVRALPIGGKNKLRRAQFAINWAEQVPGRILRPDPEPEWWDAYKTQLAAFMGEKDEIDDMVDITGMAGRIGEEYKGYVGSHDDDYGIELFGQRKGGVG